MWLSLLTRRFLYGNGGNGKRGFGPVAVQQPREHLQQEPQISVVALLFGARDGYLLIDLAKSSFKPCLDLAELLGWRAENSC